MSAATIKPPVFVYMMIAGWRTQHMLRRSRRRPRRLARVAWAAATLPSMERDIEPGGSRRHNAARRIA
jgi:hypothetical protein